MDPNTSDIVVWRDDGMPESPRFGDVYRSRGTQGDAGWSQARHVFLKGCGLLRNEEVEPASGQSTTSAESTTSTAWAHAPVWQILETGLGLGLNFLATWHAWRADPERPQRLFYSAVEAWPPEPASILRSAAAFPDLMPMAQELAAQWHGLLPGVHRLQFEGGHLQLTLAVGEAQTMLGELSGQFDSIFLDGFSPSRNPDMWSLHTLKAVSRLARRGAMAASWCVAGEVRQHLTTCGFSVERVPGLPPKRHALRARFEPHWQPKPRTPAFATIPLPHETSGKRCLVIGSGLSGASCAYSLALRGWNVTVLDRGAQPAAGASGLPAGIVAPHVSPDDRPLSRLTRAGVQATMTRARHLLREDTDYGATGVLERHAPGERRLPATWQSAADVLANRPETFSAAAPETIEKAQLAGICLGGTQLALWHAEGGWIQPAALVRAMLTAPGVTWLGQRTVSQLVPLPGEAPAWRALDESGTTLADADLVILASGFDTRALVQSVAVEESAQPELPLHALRGQVAFGPMPQQPSPAALPPFPINGHGSLIGNVPAGEANIWVTGSTFERGNAKAELLDADHAHNLQRLRELLPEAAYALQEQWHDGRARSWAAVRATLPDRLPAVGPVLPPEPNTRTQAAASTHSLQICTGMGARGLTLAVLCGEILAASLHDEPLPVERSLAERLRANRFRG